MLVVLDSFLDSTEVEQYRQQLNRARWNDGRHSAGGLNQLSKRNDQVDPACNIGQTLANDLLGKMGHHATLVSACLPHRIFPPVFNRYSENQAYGAHVDAAIMQMPGSGQVLRSDISMTVFLTSPDEYSGGELVIEGQFGAQEVKLEAGDAVVYPSSSLHRVNAVSGGTRIAAITWMQSMVADNEARSLLFDLDESIQSLTNAGNAPAELLRLTSVYHNLVRRMSIV